MGVKIRNFPGLNNQMGLLEIENRLCQDIIKRKQEKLSSLRMGQGWSKYPLHRYGDIIVEEVQLGGVHGSYHQLVVHI